MAGIEEAFEKFVTRVSDRERSPAEEPLSNYKSYSENELLSSLDAKMPNLEIVDDELVTMPMFKPKDVAPPKSYSPMPNIYNKRREGILELATGGRVGFSSGGIKLARLISEALLDLKIVYICWATLLNLKEPKKQN